MSQKLYSVTATVVTTIGDEIWADSKEQAKQIYYDRFSKNANNMVANYHDRVLKIYSIDNTTPIRLFANRPKSEEQSET